MKHLKNFESINESTNVLDTNLLEDAWYILNMLHYLVDEGYIKNDKWTITDIEDMPKDYKNFQTIEDAQEWLDRIIPIVNNFSIAIEKFNN